MPSSVLLLAQTLIRFPSITPHDHGCLDFIEAYLAPLGFISHRLDKQGTSNLYAKCDRGGKNYCFAGHTDVVPPIDNALWTYPPFAAEVHHNILYGRGAVDMKGGIAAYLAALPVLLKKHPDESFSLLLTSDEEGDATYGTPVVLEWLRAHNETIDICLVGEPTARTSIGDTIKIGARGSLNALLKVKGVAGHVAYQNLAKNPIPSLLTFLQTLQEPLDQGTDIFEKSTLQITSIDVGNATTNLIPDNVTARFNVRFNPHHTGESLEHYFKHRASNLLEDYELHMITTGEAFEGCKTHIAASYAKKIDHLTGKNVELSTHGGTSDARFIKDICPVFELGLRTDQAHKINEHVSIEDLETLQKIYETIF